MGVNNYQTILRIELNDQMCYSEHHLMVPEHFYCWVAGSFNEEVTILGVIFTRVHRVHWGGGVQWPLYAFKNVDYDALHFHTGSVKSTFSKYSFGREGEVTKNNTLCTLLIICTIIDDPLHYTNVIFFAL